MYFTKWNPTVASQEKLFLSGVHVAAWGRVADVSSCWMNGSVDAQVYKKCQVKGQFCGRFKWNVHVTLYLLFQFEQNKTQPWNWSQLLETSLNWFQSWTSDTVWGLFDSPFICLLTVDKNTPKGGTQQQQQPTQPHRTHGPPTVVPPTVAKREDTDQSLQQLQGLVTASHRGLEALAVVLQRTLIEVSEVFLLCVTEVAFCN